jgi:hypothetical protein
VLRTLLHRFADVCSVPLLLLYHAQRFYDPWGGRRADVERMLYELAPPIPIVYEEIFIFVDPAAGGPGSDYAIMSVTRSRGILVVS